MIMLVVKAIIFLYCAARVCSASWGRPLFVRSPISMTEHCDNPRETKKNHRFLSCSLAGAISCSFSHSIFVPLDAVKTRLQAFGSVGQPRTWQLLIDIVQSGGLGALFTGLLPTAAGYFLQGGVKFGCYDLFKHKAAELTGQPVGSQPVKTLLLCSAAAEVLASVALSPLETAKVHMMLSSSRTGLLGSVAQIVRRAGLGGLLSGLPLILLRQLPYTCVKLTSYDALLAATVRGAASIGRRVPLSLCQLSSGVCAGLLAAVISQPADVLLARACRSAQGGATEACRPGELLRSLRRLGLSGSFAGLRQRAVMVAALTAMQFLIYERTRLAISHALERRDGEG